MKVAERIPAQTAEKSQYLVRKYNDVTVRYVLRYPGKIRREVLRRAVKAVIDRVDVLHGSLLEEKGKLVWKIWEDVPEYAYFRYEENENVDLAAARAALECVEFDAPVKLSCTLVCGAEKSAVVLRMSHLVMDGGDSKYLLGKVVEAYNRILQTGSAEGLAVKNGSRDPAQVYAHLTKQEQRALWKNPMGGVDNPFPFADREMGEPVLLRRVIGREIMEAARNRGREYGATANDLLLTAVYRAFGAVAGMEGKKPLSVAAMMDLRRHCPGGDSAGLTNLAGALRTQLTEGVTGSFADTLKELAAQTRKDKADPQAGLIGVPLMHLLVGKLPLSVLRKAADMVYGSMALGLTNMGNLRAGDLALGSQEPTDALLGGPVKKKPGVQVSALSLEGQCSLVIAGEYAMGDLGALYGFLDGIVREIAEFAEEK